MLVVHTQAQVCPVHRQTCEGHEPGDLWNQGDQDVRLGVCLQGACGWHSQVGALVSKYCLHVLFQKGDLYT